MSLNPTGNVSYNWNYHRQDKEDYSLELTGTVVAMQEVQARDYNPDSSQPGRPSTWPDGNPKMNIRIGLATQDGKLKSVTFMKAGKKQVSGEKPSLHMQLFGLTNGNMMELMGKTIHLWTWPANPNNNQAWGRGNPRLFGVEEVTDGTSYSLAAPLPEEFKVPELFCNDGVSGGQLNQPTPQAPQQIQMPPSVQPTQNGCYLPPQPQPVYSQYPVAQQYPAPQQYPAVQQYPAQQPVASSAPMPSGMDPAVAQAMQAIGAQNVQPVASVYDDDIPF